MLLTLNHQNVGPNPTGSIYGVIVITVSTSALQAERRGSIPRDSTLCLLSSVGRAFGLHPKGQRSESVSRYSMPFYLLSQVVMGFMGW